MCGIVGIVDFDAPVDPRRVMRMGDVLQHRGPDGAGLWYRPEVALGARRLAIVDVPNGRQPTWNEDESVYVVFNGEIYNHRSIRQALTTRGHRFRSNSDVEVIPHLYEECGLAFINELDGDFGIALWDSAQRRLVLTRDRVGVKPLLYFIQDARLVFASEVKGIFASGCTSITIDPSPGFERAKATPREPGRRRRRAGGLMVAGIRTLAAGS